MRTIATAKISRPNAKGLIHRKRLFRLLDSARKKPVVWVTGPAGSGKTSLIAGYLDARKLPCLWYQADERDSDIASFFYYLGLAAKKAAPRYRKPLPLLTPEYLGGIATFTRRFFENLYSRLKPPFALVLDNYQDVPEESQFHTIVQNGLALLPEGIQAIVLSRNEPPPPFTRLRANNAIRVVGWNDLRFTLEETKQFIRRKEKPAAHVVERLHAKTEGWVAGLVLLMEGAGAQQVEPQSPGDHFQPQVFDYFAGEVFNKLDSETAAFLMTTAFLPTITVGAAEKLTGRKNAGAILAGLNRNNFFTGKISGPAPAYRFHPLFRAFLQARVAGTTENFAPLRIKAARLLLDEGQTEDAIELFYSAQDWNGLIQLIMGNSQQLIAQGRNRTLQEWIEKLPEEISAKDPWLLFWSGVCRMPFDPVRSRTVFEGALPLFEGRGDDQGALLTWSGIVQTFLFEFHDFRPLDRWIEWIDERISRGLSFTSPEIEASVVTGMTGILAWRRPDLPDKKIWLDRALALPGKCGNIDACMRAYTNSALYYIWMGEFSQCGGLIHEMRSMIKSNPLSPLRLLSLKITEAMLYSSSSDFYKDAMQAVSEGLSIAEETGVHLMSPTLYIQGVFASLNTGDTKKAAEFLRQAERSVGEDRRINLSHYLFSAAWCALVSGDTAQAVAFARKGLQLIQKTGAPLAETTIRMVLSHALYENGEHAEIRTHLDAVQVLVSQTGSLYSAFLYCFTEAYFAFEQGDRGRGLEALRQAMETGRRNNFLTMVYFWRPAVLSRLCAEALDAGIEVEYARSMIRKLRLVPDERARNSETWPWPLKIVTLGCFRMLKDGKPAESGRKAQHKPLMLLKALIASGGSEVPEERITDLLWPDSDGDAAHSAFSTTLQRLRSLAGYDALLLNDRRLSVDPRFCSVDAWSFERMHERAEALWRRANDQNGSKQESISADAYYHGEEALKLYQGYFLLGDTGAAWTAAYRERLRSKFLRLVLQQGLYLEESAQWRKAVETFERGLETDELAEEFYQHLMVCYQKLGQKAEAIMIYNRCRTVLSSSLGIDPSAKTEAIYSSLLK